jgi:hypothetical protein
MVIKQTSKGNNNIQVGGVFTSDGIDFKELKLPFGNIEFDPSKTKGSCIVGNDIYLDGIKLPALPKKTRNKNVECVNSKLWVNGYFWTGTKWKRMSKLRFRLMRK